MGCATTTTAPGRAPTPPSLQRLDALHGLRDSAGRPLRFTQTHRLRHTRAAELLNDGVPFHVVQRYLGHQRPEMTARYAATLAATAEAEFLKHKKIGATSGSGNATASWPPSTRSSPS